MNRLFFPNLQPQAEYNPLSQVIHLHTATAAEFETRHSLLPKLPLVAHETAHWLDHLSTLTGQRSLVLIYNAFHARMNEDLNEFWRIAAMYRELQSQMTPRYFWEIYPSDEAQRYTGRWRWGVSCGLRFDFDGRLRRDAPIVFIRFFTDDWKPIARAPISAAALFETNAMAAELSAHIDYLSYLEGESLQQEVERWQSEIRGWLYGKDMTVYSVAAHLAANTIHTPDVSVALSLSSRVGTLALNSTSVMFESLGVPEIFRDTFRERNDHLIRRCDIGYLYAAIFEHARQYEGKVDAPAVQELLRIAGLPDVDELQKSTVTEMKRVEAEVVNGPLRSRVLKLLSLGRELFGMRGVCGAPQDFLPDLQSRHLPILAFRDGTVKATKERMDEYAHDPLAWLEEAKQLEHQLEEFYGACGE